MALTVLALLTPMRTHAESAAAASGKALEQSYLKARQMGETATSKKIYAATKPLHDHARSLESKERRETFRRFARHSGSFFKGFSSTSKTPAINPKLTSPVRTGSTGTVTGSAGAKGVDFGSGNEKNENPAVGVDGVILDR